MKRIKLFVLAALVAALSVPLLFQHAPPAEAQTSILLPPVRTTANFFERRAISKIGSAVGSAQNVSWLFDDFQEAGTGITVPVGWISSGSGTAASVMGSIGDEGGGVSEITTGATAGSGVTHASASPLIRDVTTKPFYVAYRFKITTAVTTQTKMFVALRNAAANKTIACGVLATIGGAAATKFVIQYDGNEAGSVIDTGVVFDTSYHICEVWGLGDNKLHAAWDLGADLTAGGVTMASAPTDSMSGYRGGNNGADAVARTSRTDYLAVLTKRN